MSNTNNENTVSMPLLVIEAEGKIITSNFAEFAEQVRTRLAEFNTNLRTDEDFDQAAADVKIIKGAEDSLKAAKEKALADAEELNALFSQIDDLSGELSKARLGLTRQIDDQKAKLKSQIIDGALEMLDCDKSMRSTFRAEIEAATKSKKNFATMREAVRVALQIANDKIGRCKAMLDEFSAEHGDTLLPDRRNLEASDPVVLAGELLRRIEAARAQAEAKRLREEAEKAKADAEKARQEAAQAKRANEPQPTVQAPQEAAKAQPAADDRWLPDPDDAPPASQPEADQSAGDEWDEFFEAVASAFATLKPARAKLQHPENIERAKVFALKVNKAWEEANQ